MIAILLTPPLPPPQVRGLHDGDKKIGEMHWWGLLKDWWWDSSNEGFACSIFDALAHIHWGSMVSEHSVVTVCLFAVCIGDNLNRSSDHVTIHLEGQLLQDIGVAVKFHGKLLLLLQILLERLVFIDRSDVPPDQLDIALPETTELQGEGLAYAGVETCLVAQLLRFHCGRSAGKHVQMQQTTSKAALFCDLANGSVMATLTAVASSFGQHILVALQEMEHANLPSGQTEDDGAGALDEGFRRVLFGLESGNGHVGLSREAGDLLLETCGRYIRQQQPPVGQVDLYVQFWIRCES